MGKIELKDQEILEIVLRDKVEIAHNCLDKVLVSKFRMMLLGDVDPESKDCYDYNMGKLESILNLRKACA